MVTNFVANAATRGKKKGPWGLAQISIEKAVRKSKYTKRRAIGRRKRKNRGAKDTKERQPRKIFKVEKVPETSTAVGKYLYVNHGTEEAGKVFESFNISSNNIIDVSKYRVIDIDATEKGHAVVIDEQNGEDLVFICAKIDKRQSNSWMGGKRGFNKVRDSIALLKKCKKNQSRGAATSGVNQGYKLIGHRKDQLSSKNGEYVCIPGSDEEDCKNLKTIYSELSYKMEMGGRTMGNALYETGIYRKVQEHSGVPAVGKPEESKKKKKYKQIQKAKPTSLATALAVGGIYWSKAHKDKDFYLSVLSCLTASSHDNGKVIHYFIFPDYHFMIPIKTGEILLFNPSITHSCSNPSLSNSFIFSSYVSKTTVLVEEATRLRAEGLIDSA